MATYNCWIPFFFVLFFFWDRWYHRKKKQECWKIYLYVFVYLKTKPDFVFLTSEIDVSSGEHCSSFLDGKINTRWFVVVEVDDDDEDWSEMWDWFCVLLLRSQSRHKLMFLIVVDHDERDSESALLISWKYSTFRINAVQMLATMKHTTAKRLFFCCNFLWEYFIPKILNSCLFHLFSVLFFFFTISALCYWNDDSTFVVFLISFFFLLFACWFFWKQIFFLFCCVWRSHSDFLF